MAKRIFAIAAIAFAAIFAVPTAAMAAGYVPPGNVSSSGGPTSAPGVPAKVTFAPHSYNNDEFVSVSVTGDPAPTLGTIGTATSTYKATSTGGLNFKVIIPSTATSSSVYSIVATGLASGNVGTYRITVAGTGASTAVSNGLAYTGGTISMLVVWSAAGLLALGAALLIMRRVVRRQRSNA